MNNTIPHVIHCFWTGGPKTKLAQKCLASWRRFAPDWKIREWNLDDLPEAARSRGFLAEAVRLRRWAAASDWVRMWALREEGGVYLDLDVELVAPIDDLCAEPWIASEWKVGGGTWLNPGGGIALERGSALAADMLARYDRDGYRHDREMMVVINGNLRAAFAATGATPRVLPPEAMCPVDPDGRLHRTPDTHGIHWYAMSGATPAVRFCRWLAWHRLGWIVSLLRKVRHRK